jgi:hypothetical protein
MGPVAKNAREHSTAGPVLRAVSFRDPTPRSADRLHQQILAKHVGMHEWGRSWAHKCKRLSTSASAASPSPRVASCRWCGSLSMMPIRKAQVTKPLKG